MFTNNSTIDNAKWSTEQARETQSSEYGTYALIA